MAEGSSRYIAIKRETVENTAPSGAYQKYRTTGGSGIMNERSSITSNEIRDDRMVSVHRLGTNQPNASIPIEFSWETFDEMLEGALGSDWTADYALTETVTITAAGDTIILEDNSSWTDKGLAAGDYLIVRNSDSDDGIYVVNAFSTTTGTNDTVSVYAADGSSAVTFTGSTTDEVNIEGGVYGGSIDTTGNTITVSATNKTFTAASAVFGDIRVGDAVYFTNFTNAGNNGYHVVTTATDTVLTFSGSTLTNETQSTNTVEFAAYGAQVTVGSDLPTFTVEEGFTDVTEYHYMTGTKVSTFSMSIQPDAIVTGEVALQGQQYSGFSATPVSGSTTAQTTTDVFDSYTGSLYFGSDLQCVITGMDFTLENNLNRRYALMQQNPCSIGEGRSIVTGTVNAFFPNSDLADNFDAESLFEVRIQLQDVSGNSYTFGWPRLKFTSDSRDVTENDVTESFGFQALGGDATLMNMYVRKQPAVPS